MNEFFESQLFNLGGRDFTLGQVSVAVASIIGTLILYFLVRRYFLPRYFKKENIQESTQGKIQRLLISILTLVALLGAIVGLEIDLLFYSTDNIDFRITTILGAILILQTARLLDWMISKILLYNYHRRLEQQETPKEIKQQSVKDVEGLASRTVQYSVYVFAVIIILQAFNLDYTLFSFEDHEFKISNIAWAVLILLIAQLASWILTQLVLRSYYKKSEVNIGSQFAINQLLKYIIFTIAAFIAIESLGFKMTVIWGGAAALLVGVGLGLQQTFNDLISGIILLFERSVEVGNVIEVSGLVGTVQRIGLRTSIVETRDNISVVVPNSKLIVDNVINWSHYDDKARFHIDLGVAYGSDTEMVRNLLLEVAKNNVYVLDFPSPIVRLIEFGDSSLSFQLHFWSHNFVIIEDIKSDLRFAIDRIFRENNVVIPFPQQDVWIRKEES